MTLIAASDLAPARRRGRTPLLPRRFPFPEECPSDENADDHSNSGSQDSARSLLLRREVCHRSIYDPLNESVCLLEGVSTTHPGLPSIDVPSMPHSTFLTTLPRHPYPSGSMSTTHRTTPSYSSYQTYPRISQKPLLASEDSREDNSSSDGTSFMKSSQDGLTRILLAMVFALCLVVLVLLGAGVFFYVRTHQMCEFLFVPEVSGGFGLHESEGDGKPVNPYETLMTQDVGQQDAMSSHLMSLFDAENIRLNLRWLTEDIHVAGTDEQLALMDRIQETFKSLGLEVSTHEYEVLLNYPDYDQPNTVHHWDGTDWQVVSEGVSKPEDVEATTDDEDLDVASMDFRSRVWWNAYSNNGSVIANIVYANFGTDDDFHFLEKQNISIRGKVVLIRYGSLFRGEKVKNAEKRGASGVILYSDPADFALNGNVTFPQQVWLPRQAAQRGTLLRFAGDPETPLMPAKPYAYREADDAELRKRGVLPSIPVTSISYGDAEDIMQKLDGVEVTNPRWKGNMRVDYRLTGTAVFRLEVRSISRRRSIKNVVGLFRGSEEPDRVVFLSNHADAWVRGAVDPGTGTATLLEIARVVRQAHETTGWRPRRTLAFAVWDAEEFGLVGSSEFVEEMLRPLQASAVAVINVDNINGNNTLSVKSVPLLYRTIVRAAGRVTHPNPAEVGNGRPTLLDAWRFYTPKGPLPGDRSVPAIGLPNTGSDHQKFITYAGIPVMDFKMESAPVYSFMLYHTMYEVAWTVEHLIDPTGEVLLAAGRLWLEVAHSLADTLIVPFGIDDYAAFLSEEVKRLQSQLVYYGIDAVLGDGVYADVMSKLHVALAEFHARAHHLQHLVHAVNHGDRQLTLRQAEKINSRFMQLERAFIADHGIYPERPGERHVVFGVPDNDIAASDAFAVVMDPVARFLEALDEKTKADQLVRIRQGLAKLQYAVESATHLLHLDGF